MASCASVHSGGNNERGKPLRKLEECSRAISFLAGTHYLLQSGLGGKQVEGLKGTPRFAFKTSRTTSVPEHGFLAIMVQVR